MITSIRHHLLLHLGGSHHEGIPARRVDRHKQAPAEGTLLEAGRTVGRSYTGPGEGRSRDGKGPRTAPEEAVAGSRP